MANNSDALSRAVDRGDIDMVNILLDRGADINKSDALSRAVDRGDIDMVNILLDRGADINKSDALSRALDRGHIDMVKILIDRGATMNKIAKIKEELSVPSTSDVNDPLHEQTQEVEKEQMEQQQQQQQQFTAGIADNVETPCNITITVVGHKGVGKSCFVKQIQKELIPVGGPNSTDTAEFYVNYLAYNPNTGSRKKLDENGEVESGRQRLKRIIDRYRKRGTTDKESSASRTNLQDQDVKNKPEFPTKTRVRDEVASTTPSAAPSPSPPVPSSQSSSASSSTTKLDKKLSSEQRNFMEEIMQTKPEEKDKQMKDLITIYDFGGEQVFYNTHHCFMSSNMVFVLVFDVAMCLDPNRSKDGYERIETWLKSIATYAIDQAAGGKGTPPVILVGSHLDLVSQDTQKQEEAFGEVLKRLYENPQLSEIMENHVQDMYPISHLNDSEKNQDIYEEVWNKVIEIAPLQSRWNKPIPARWLALEHQMVKRKNSGSVILTYEELLEINNQSLIPLTEDELMDFLKNFRFAGPFLCFDFQSMRPFVVLRPQWIINAFKAIITDPKFTAGLPKKLQLQWTQYESTGVLTLDLIRRLWEHKDDKSFLANMKTLCNIMETLGLLANPLQDNSDDDVDYFIVPSTLRKGDPEIIRSVLDDPETVATVSLCFKFDNTFIPQAVWDKMIAACIHRFQRLNEHGHDGTMFIQRGFVCLSADFLWNFIVNCKENVMKITMFKKDTDQSVPAGAGVNLLSILEFHLKRILELNHQGHLKYQFYLHNDYSFSDNDKMVKVEDLRQTPRLQCHSSNEKRWLEREDIQVWFKRPDQKSKRTQRRHIDPMKDLPERNLSIKEMSRVSRYIGKSYQTFFVELGCDGLVIEQKMAENRALSFRSLITKIFIHLLNTELDVGFTTVADAMSEHGLDPLTLYNTLDDNRDTLFIDNTLSESWLQKCLTVYDAPVIADHVSPKEYFNLFLELGIPPNRVDHFDINFRNDTTLNKITAMMKEVIEKANPRPTLNTVLLAMMECDMNTHALITALSS